MLRSFYFAWQGIKFVFKSERNMKIHLSLAVLALLLAYLLGIPKVEFLFVLAAIFLVMSLEMINTAIETMTDLITTEIHPLAKTAKDVASGAVLWVSIFALIIGLYVFLPPLFALLK